MPGFELLAIAIVALLVGYCMTRGIMDWRSGRRLLGAVGIGIGLIVLASAMIPIETHATKIDLPAQP